MKIAITGNIGSGKSEAIKFLTSLGYKCISSDQIIKSLYQNNQSRDYILKRIGVIDKNYKEEIIHYYMLRKKLSPPNLNNTFLSFMKFPCYLKSNLLKTLAPQYLS